MDLFDGLTQAGLSHRRADLKSSVFAQRVPSTLVDSGAQGLLELEPLASLFSVPASCDTRADEAGRCMRHVDQSVWLRCDEYYYAIIGRLATLRSAAGAPSKDLTGREIERTIGYMENLLQSVAGQRLTIREFAEQMVRCTQFALQMKTLGTSVRCAKLSGVLEWLDARVKTPLDHAAMVTDDVSLLLDSISAFGECDLRSFVDAFSRLRSALASTRAVVGVLHERLAWLRGCDMALSCFIEEPCRTIDSGIRTIRDSVAACTLLLRSGSLGDPLSGLASRIACFLGPLVDNLAFYVPLQFLDDREGGDLLTTSFDTLIEATLVSVQNLLNDQDELRKMTAESEVHAVDGLFENYFQAMQNWLVRRSSVVGLQSVSSALGAFSKALRGARDVQNHLRSSSAFVVQFEALARHALLELVAFHKSTCKFAYVLCDLFANIAQNGFCDTFELGQMIPGEEEGETTGKMEFEGTGMGEGEGVRDVSDQIQEESQIEGLKDEKDSQTKDAQAPEKKLTEEERDQGFEMEGEFDGDMFDVEQPQRNEADADEDETKSVDDKMGDLGKDASVFDERLWGDESDVDEKEQGSREESEMKENDAPISDPRQEESSLVASTEDSKSADKDRKPKSQEQQREFSDETSPAGQEEMSDAPINEDNPEAFEESKGAQFEAPSPAMPDEGASADQLEVPDGIDIDSEQEHQDDAGEGDKVEDQLSVDEERAEEISPEEEARSSDDVQAQDVDMADASNDGLRDAMEEQKVAENKQEEVQSAEGIAHGPSGQKTKASETSELEQNESLDRGEMEGVENDRQSEEFAEKTSSFGRSGRHDRKQAGSRNPDEPNPNRSLGDALKKWKRRLNMVDSKTEESYSAESPKDEVEDNPEAQAYEFKEQAADMPGVGEEQTLGAASRDQWQPLDQENAEDSAFSPTKPPEEDDIAMPEQNSAPVESDPPSEKRPSTKKAADAASARTDKQPAEPQGIEAEPDTRTRATGTSIIGAASAVTEEEAMSDPPETANETKPHLREQLEQMLIEWRTGGRSLDERAVQLWRGYEALTHDLSLELCEQLRLILEPTLASKLQGDYRTGKRLNMKRIIPYIASSFRKDKIWLRRTKPSKREYQVMLAVDDSRSMSDSKSIQLAYESVAMISKALALLEVGELGVVKFGDDVSLLHAFGVPFDNEAGARLLQQFTFAQDRTRVGDLISQTTQLLTEARERSSNADLWQLQIILSDGICEDHARLKQLVLDAAEKRILVVFVIIDNRPERDTILEMKSVSYPNGKLTIRGYLDTFPFQFYVVLRDIQSLPMILSDALRQWMEMARNS